jgi:hypothetical protein
VWDDEEERVMHQEGRQYQGMDNIKKCHDEDTHPGCITSRVKGGSGDISVPASCPLQADLRPIRNLDDMVSKT